jgi:hypothetical protein
MELLLEKACASCMKLNQLRRGFTREAFIGLTGCPGCLYDFEDEFLKYLSIIESSVELIELFDSEGIS